MKAQPDTMFFIVALKNDLRDNTDEEIRVLAQYGRGMVTGEEGCNLSYELGCKYCGIDSVPFFEVFTVTTKPSHISDFPYGIAQSTLCVNQFFDEAIEYLLKKKTTVEIQFDFYILFSYFHISLPRK